MINLKKLFSTPLQAVPNKIVIPLLVIALLGFADAAYLTIEHFRNVIPPCTITGGCETVLTSEYASILGMPVSLIGALYYLFILVGLFAYLEGRHEKFLRSALLLTAAGLLASLWFVYLQVFVIHSYCLYCLISATTSILLFVISWLALSKYRSQNTIIHEQ